MNKSKKLFNLKSVDLNHEKNYAKNINRITGSTLMAVGDITLFLVNNGADLELNYVNTDANVVGIAITF